MGHSNDCDMRATIVDAARKDYACMWSKHCTACEGRGEVGSGAIDQHSGLADIDACGECIEKGKCPRCGADGVVTENSDVVPCKACGWDEKDGRGMPYAYECDGDCCAPDSETDYDIDVPPAIPPDGMLPVLDVDTMTVVDHVRVTELDVQVDVEGGILRRDRGSFLF